VRVSTWGLAKNAGFTHKKVGKYALAPRILEAWGT